MEYNDFSNDGILRTRGDKETNINLDLHAQGLEERNAISGNRKWPQFGEQMRTTIPWRKDQFWGALGHPVTSSSQSNMQEQTHS